MLKLCLIWDSLFKQDMWKTLRKNQTPEEKEFYVKKENLFLFSNKDFLIFLIDNWFFHSMAFCSTNYTCLFKYFNCFINSRENIFFINSITKHYIFEKNHRIKERSALLFFKIWSYYVCYFRKTNSQLLLYRK